MHQRSIFFLHNPKAAGSSLQRLFRSLFGADEVAPIFSNAPNDHRAKGSSVARHRGYAFYAGHFGYDAYKSLSEGHVLITNFREPIARIVSLYRYWRNSVSIADLTDIHPRDAAVVIRSHELDFPSFIRCDDADLLLYISNFHFRQLHRSPWEISAIHPWHRLQVRRRISYMSWFYIAETPHASALLLKRAFPELSSVELPVENTSQGERIGLTPEDVEYLIRLNHLDYDIYYHALRLQFARLARQRARITR